MLLGVVITYAADYIHSPSKFLQYLPLVFLDNTRHKHYAYVVTIYGVREKGEST